jgi:hypothetical protein
MEKATLTPFSIRGRGSAFRSQKTSWAPLASRLVSEEGVGGAVLVDFAVGFGGWALGFADFFGCGGELGQSFVS